MQRNPFSGRCKHEVHHCMIEAFVKPKIISVVYKHTASIQAHHHTSVDGASSMSFRPQEYMVKVEVVIILGQVGIIRGRINTFLLAILQFRVVLLPPPSPFVCICRFLFALFLPNAINKSKLACVLSLGLCCNYNIL